MHCVIYFAFFPLAAYKDNICWYVSLTAIKETELTGEPKAQFVKLVGA